VDVKATAGCLIGAVVLALAGAAVLAFGRLERDLSRAGEDFVVSRYDEPAEALDKAERYFSYGSYLPWVGNDALNDIRARKALLRYWQRDYAAVIPQQTDPVGVVAPDNIELQLIVANAVYRTGAAQAADRQSMLEALDQAIGAYAAVLKNADRQEDAAYNYEYLVRLRDEVDKGRRKPGGEAQEKGPEGAPGAPPTLESKMGDFKIYIPLESQERQENGAAGKAAPIKRKG
jgi:hypothetical protein